MGASKRHKVCSMEGIVAVMRPDRLYHVGNLARAYETRPEHIRAMLEAAVAEGLVDRVKYHGDTCYRLEWSQAVDGDRVAPPYRTLNLDKTLEGYDKSLRSFASLCMTVRR